MTAAYLARKGAATVVLVHRSTFPGREQWDELLATLAHDELTIMKIRQLKAIEKTGCRLKLVQAELGTNYLSLFQIFEDLVKQYNHITGVIHTAGITGPETHFSAEQVSIELSEKIFTSKVDGVRHLMQAIEHFSPVFCLLTSSLSPFLGGLGLSAYTAAHCFMDMTVAQNHLKQHLSFQKSQADYLPTDDSLSEPKQSTIVRTINWEGRAPMDSALSDNATGNSVSRFWMSEEEVGTCLEQVLKEHQPHQVIVATGDIESRMRQWQNFSRNFRKNLLDHTSSLRSETTVETAEGQNNDVEHSSYSLDNISETLRGLAIELLGVQSLKDTDSFFNFGGTSLTALQFRDEFKKYFSSEYRLRVFITVLPFWNWLRSSITRWIKTN
ncbi:beta-ketoacyl reductase [Colwellia sp. MSW7]|uniref:Beta-ketoacyl reductase n=1 Tax=Colwellia maritima TaxID=2912588 RepID=A0ABS9X7G1_9GAMM|nr:beta-ketoacyl reductase [Colwellia maritima]MCI2286156.1 beta-ketoacyl reductase [Colwellia maritima]